MIIRLLASLATMAALGSVLFLSIWAEESKEESTADDFTTKPKKVARGEKKKLRPAEN